MLFAQYVLTGLFLAVVALVSAEEFGGVISKFEDGKITFKKFKKGDIVTFAGCNRVHPETKADTGALQTFTITADYAGGAGNINISPAIVVAGATQNFSASPTGGGAVTKGSGHIVRRTISNDG